MRFAPKVGDLIYIRWRDHCTAGAVGWQHFDEIEGDPVDCETVGFVAVINPEAITVMATVSREDGADTMGSVAMTRLRNCITHGKIIKRFR